MSELSSSQWSETAASNTQAAPNGFPEGQPPGSLNDGMREVMAQVKRFWGRINGRYASTGSSNAYVLTPDVALAAYQTGERYSFRANFANTGSATLNISGLGSRAIKKMGASGKANLAAGDIQSGQPVTVEYDGTDMVMVTPTANTLTATTDININGLTEDTAPDLGADYVQTYDASATANKKVLLGRLNGVLATEQASTSGTAIDFTSIPSWAKRITISFVGVSTDSTGNLLIQIGDSGGVETTDYFGAGSSFSSAATVVSNSTSGFLIPITAAAGVIHGAVTLTLEDSANNTWVCAGVLARSDTATQANVAGSKSLSATLDRVRIRTTTGNFDAGEINILYE